MQQKKIYHYCGIVKCFDTIIARNFEETTMAVSERQALNNILFKAKKRFGFSSDSKLVLDIKYLH